MQWQGNEEARQLLRAIAEQIKLPLLQIARASELGQMIPNKSNAQFHTIELSADSALGMVDSYLLGLQLASEQHTLQLEPVSISSILNDTAHQLSSVAQEYNVDLELSIAGKYEPVMAHQTALRSALTSLGYGLIGSPVSTDKQRGVIRLAVHRNRGGIVAGLYGNTDGVSTEAFQRARRLYGHVRQPLAGFTSGVASIFVADTILQAMAAQLRVTRHHNYSGLAATFQPSRQLQLV